MGLDAKQLRELIVRPALHEIDMHSDAAENLVMGTAAQESRLRYIHQLGNGPAVGLFQVEPTTFYDYWDGYLEDHPDVAQKVIGAVGLSDDELVAGFGRPDPDRCVWDLKLAALMCRIHYRRIRSPLPDAADVWGMAAYWKKYYNTTLGRGTEQEFVDNYALTQ